MMIDVDRQSNADQRSHAEQQEQYQLSLIYGYSMYGKLSRLNKDTRNREYKKKLRPKAY